MIPDGVQGASAGRFWTRRPTLTGLNPSTSFAGSIMSKHTPLGVTPHRLGERRLHQDAVVRATGVELPDDCQGASSSDAVSERRLRSLAIPSSSLFFILLRT